MIKRERLIEIMNDQYDGESETFNAEAAADLILDEIEKNKAPDKAGRVAGAASDGWLYHNPDTGTEWSVSHPVESGEVHDAENIRPATLDAFREEMFAAWKMVEEARQECLAALTPSAPIAAPARDDGALLLELAQAWRTARLAACAEPIGNTQVWTDLGATETALSQALAAIPAHASDVPGDALNKQNSD